MSAGPDQRSVFGACVYLDDGDWNYRPVMLDFTAFVPGPTTGDRPWEVDMSETLFHGDIEVLEPEFRNLKIGEVVLRIMM